MTFSRPLWASQRGGSGLWRGGLWRSQMQGGGGGGGGGEDYSNAQIGDEIGGGIYAGTISYGDGRQFHIVAAKAAGEATDLAWGDYGAVTGATDDDDGYANQDLILSSFDNGNSHAFYHCRDYGAGGFPDWYLPARNEIALVKANLGEAGHPEFTDAETPSPYRWSSTEYTDLYAYHSRLSGTQGAFNGKNVGQRVRPIRRVPV
ncbi:hypothetical protein [Billgrantia bachuensis]|uniref:DUF1566 domain-containing protein n=1 Tax=Billgrantia bachuensis TaxID=2717286 RepID=A0ABX0PQ06_9GAMM|nr:hypothetical protein [Halomonas bachuensis]NIC05265.1 hypothetical protein [Halomonas bachuensis]